MQVRLFTPMAIWELWFWCQLLRQVLKIKKTSKVGQKLAFYSHFLMFLILNCLVAADGSISWLYKFLGKFWDQLHLWICFNKKPHIYYRICILWENFELNGSLWYFVFKISHLYLTLFINPTLHVTIFNQSTIFMPVSCTKYGQTRQHFLSVKYGWS